MGERDGAGGREAVPDPIDLQVGARIRLRRVMMGMSQERLGEQIGLTFQQVQKYESGANRVSASRLFHIAHALGVAIGYFFDGRDGASGASRGPNDLPDQVPGFAADQAAFGAPASAGPAAGPAAGDEVLYRRETLELVRAYYRITNPAARKSVYDLVRSLAPEAS